MQNMLSRLLVPLAGSLVILSFVLLPWIVIAPQSYLDANVQQVIDWLLEALGRWRPSRVRALLCGFSVSKMEMVLPAGCPVI